MGKGSERELLLRTMVLEEEYISCEFWAQPHCSQHFPHIILFKAFDSISESITLLTIFCKVDPILRNNLRMFMTLDLWRINPE